MTFRGVINLKFRSLLFHENVAFIFLKSKFWLYKLIKRFIETYKKNMYLSNKNCSISQLDY